MSIRIHVKKGRKEGEYFPEIKIKNQTFALSPVDERRLAFWYKDMFEVALSRITFWELLKLKWKHRRRTWNRIFTR